MEARRAEQLGAAIAEEELALVRNASSQNGPKFQPRGVRAKSEQRPAGLLGQVTVHSRAAARHGVVDDSSAQCWG